MEEEHSKLQKRLVEAAKATGADPGFRIEVMVEGVKSSYAWNMSNGNWYSVENLTTWEEIELSPFNPLIPALTSLTKEASQYQ